VATKTQDENNTNSMPTKDLVNKDGTITALTEWATADVQNVDDLIALFGEQGVTYSTGEELTGDYKVITGDEKQAFCKRIIGKRLAVVKWAFRDGQQHNTEFVTMHLIIDGVGKIIVNDGAKSGMYGQLSRITTERLGQGWASDRAHAGLLVDRGIKQNKTFQYDTRTGKAIKKGEDVPDEFQGTSHPSYSFEF
jgi:hypothetical protein